MLDIFGLVFKKIIGEQIKLVLTNYIKLGTPKFLIKLLITFRLTE